MDISLEKIFFVITGIGYFVKTIEIFYYNRKNFELISGSITSIFIIAMATRI